MQKVIPHKIFRVIDANINRCKEGLRVTEDIFRFVLEDDALRRELRGIRHALDKIKANKKTREEMLAARDSLNDRGMPLDGLEVRRKNVSDLFYVNIQRVKESLRVLEEFLKLVDLKTVPLIKKSRYRVYEIERRAFRKWFSKAPGR